MSGVSIDEIRERQEEILQLSDNMKKVQSQVFFILANYPEARSNDGVLLCNWLQTFKGVNNMGGLLKLAADNQFNFETVRRSRQKIQAAGLYLPDEETVRNRRRLQGIWRAVMTHDEAHTAAR